MPDVAVRDAKPVQPSIDALLAQASSREPFAHDDGKSGVRMERVVIDDERFVLKHLSAADDWIMRATGDLACRPITLWRTGLLDRLPAHIDHTIVGAAWEDHPGALRRGAILMRDVGDWLLPEGDAEIPLELHHRFLEHMAELHASFWGWTDDGALTALGTRLVWFGPRLAEAETAFGGDNRVPTRLVPDGWRRFRERARRSVEAVFRLLDDPDPLIAALRSTPQTFVHGDWKAGNLGSHPDGRTILIDWAYGGEAPGCLDLAHYLCLNRARLPEPKEAALSAYRSALERNGVDTSPWWERQVALCLLAMLCNFGWEKALGEQPDDLDELDWWDRRASEGAGLLG